MATATLYVFILACITTSLGNIYYNCYECDELPICCDPIYSEPFTTDSISPTTTTSMDTTTAAPPDPTIITDSMTTTSMDTLTTDSNPDPTIPDPTIPDSMTTSTETPTTTDGRLIEPEVCKYWTSSRQLGVYGPGAGAPLDVCFGAFSGVELTSTSHIYKCSDDKSTVEQWYYTGSSDCNPATATTATKLNTFTFDPINNPDTDIFNCDGEPCAYYIILDGTAHRDQRCPYDTGKDYTTGANDYATWHEKLLLQGCQSFDGQTSIYLRCSSSGGISRFMFDNPYCDTDGFIGSEEVLSQGTIECNYGTGRSVNCFDNDADDFDGGMTTTPGPDNTDMDVTDPDMDMDTTVPGPQFCGPGKCGDASRSERGYGYSLFVLVFIGMVQLNMYM